MEEKELNLEELNNVRIIPNAEANYENVMHNENLYREKSIEELKRLKESLQTESEEKRRNTR